MTKLCTLRPEPEPSQQTLAAVRQLVQRADDHAHTALVSDQALIDAQVGKRQLFLVIDNNSNELVGITIVGSGELDLIIDPDKRGLGFGGSALDQALALSDSSLSVWVHNMNGSAERLLSSRGFVPRRTLLKLSTDLTHLRELSRKPIVLPDGLNLEPFTPADTAEWVALNAQIFKDHPEQGSLTEADLKYRILEPWFAPENFLLLRSESGRLIGYCWLKVTEDEGEFYVIGVAPEVAGQGLGSVLFDAGNRRLASLSRLGAEFTQVSLYVEASNEAALRLYQSRGFALQRSSSQWMFDRT